MTTVTPVPGPCLELAERLRSAGHPSLRELRRHWRGDLRWSHAGRARVAAPEALAAARKSDSDPPGRP